MAEIPFDISLRNEIEAGEYKVVVRYDDRTFGARIVCWDFNDTKLLVCVNYGDEEDVLEYDWNGKHVGKSIRRPDLLIVIPESEPEFTEFEKRLWKIMKSEGSPIGPLERFTDDDKRVFHAYSGQLLTLSREQFIKDGYIIEKKAFRDAVEKIDDKHKAEMSIEYSLHCKVENRTRHAVMNWKAFQKVAQKFIDIGRADALKDLPRWKKWGNGACGNADGHPIALASGVGGIRFVSVLGITGEKYIMLDDLKKLPGFKED